MDLRTALPTTLALMFACGDARWSAPPRARLPVGVQARAIDLRGRGDRRGRDIRSEGVGP